ncbi:hypothetical protein HPB47_019471 [Ixodes persulcatus]|uniref:Uncharacterized protein n=1 Tax=Ixodes persulcatus TaxID=34615 RepID=A0AC60QI33_IXOPE|nr:hypothetical protein HPB47_019471 [Ixodes persulcatus]
MPRVGLNPTSSEEEESALEVDNAYHSVEQDMELDPHKGKKRKKKRPTKKISTSEEETPQEELGETAESAGRVEKRTRTAKSANQTDALPSKSGKDSSDISGEFRTRLDIVKMSGNQNSDKAKATPAEEAKDAGREQGEREALLLYPSNPTEGKEFAQVTTVLRSSLAPEDLGLQRPELRPIRGGAVLLSASKEGIERLEKHVKTNLELKKTPEGGTCESRCLESGASTDPSYVGHHTRTQGAPTLRKPGEPPKQSTSKGQLPAATDEPMDISGPSDDKQPDLDVKTLLTSINQKLDTLPSLTEKVDSLERSVQYMSKRFDEFEKEMKLQKTEIKDLSKRVRQMEEKEELNRVVQEQLQQEVNDLEFRSRRLNLEIHGIPAVQGENLLTSLNWLADKLEVPHLTESDSRGTTGEGRPERTEVRGLLRQQRRLSPLALGMLTTTEDGSHPFHFRGETLRLRRTSRSNYAKSAQVKAIRFSRSEV